MAARLAPEKAPQDFVWAAALVLSDHPDVHFEIAGAGPEGDAVAQLIVDLGLSEQVRMRGFVADMHKLYESIDVLVQPSHREGMPMTLLEAMAVGLLSWPLGWGRRRTSSTTGRPGCWCLPPTSPAGRSDHAPHRQRSRTGRHGHGCSRRRGDPPQRRGDGRAVRRGLPVDPHASNWARSDLSSASTA